MLAQTCLALAASSLAAVSAAVLPFQAKQYEPSLVPRAGAPITLQTLTVANLTQCGVSNISWTGPGVEPYSLEVALGGYYIGKTPVATFANISGTASVYWVVDQPTNSSMFFEITDADGQKTHLQGLPVGPATDPRNTTGLLPAGVLNGSTTTTVPAAGPSVAAAAALACPIGEGLVNATVAGWFL